MGSERRDNTAQHLLSIFTVWREDECKRDRSGGKGAEE